MTDKGWQLFVERLAQGAGPRWRKPMRSIPADPYVCRTMMTVELGQGDRAAIAWKRGSAARWTTDPDYYDACAANASLPGAEMVRRCQGHVRTSANQCRSHGELGRAACPFISLLLAHTEPRLLPAPRRRIIGRGRKSGRTCSNSIKAALNGQPGFRLRPQRLRALCLPRRAMEARRRTFPGVGRQAEPERDAMHACAIRGGCVSKPPPTAHGP